MKDIVENVFLDRHKSENPGPVKIEGACGETTNTFTKDGKLAGPGGRTGPCGTEKDHRRVYLCKNCAKAKGIN